MTARSRLPLNALRVFDAAARLGSFTLAADTLSITPGAVSRQIKALEAELGVRLFDRFNRAVALTDAGQRLAEGVAEAFDRLETVVERARPRTDGPLVVSVLHSMAAKWLVPRLNRFEERHPGIEILVSASDRAVDLAREAVDVAIRYGTGPFPGLDARPLIRNAMFPVCSPALLQRRPAPWSIADLADTLFLHDDNVREDEPDWHAWLRFIGGRGDEVDVTRGLRFSNTYLAMEAAMSGRGVTLTNECWVIDDLAAGRLARPFTGRMVTDYSFFAVCLPERADDPRVRRFRAWLEEQAKADRLPLD
jgi:LysR family glycine cleavage system transcriptional activator